MHIDWTNLKDKIKINVLDTFTSNNPRFSEQEVENGIDHFFNIILSETNIPPLKGLPKQLLPALQNLYIEKRNEAISLRAVADSLEPYLKKLSVIVNKQNQQQALENGLMGLFRVLELNDDLTKQKNNEYPYFDPTNLKDFVGKEQYLEFLSKAYFVRNEVHLAPQWGDIQIYTHLRDILVVYIYAALKYTSQINPLPKNKVFSTANEVLDREENKILYDFISFGNTTTELKTQVVNAYILHSLLDTVEMSISELKSKCDMYFDNKLTERFFERKIGKLFEEGKIMYTNSAKTTIRLSDAEKVRLDKVQQDFIENKDLFTLYFEETLTTYGIIHHADDLLEKLTEFFVSNFNIDVSEAYNSAVNINDTENILFHNFIEYLKEIVINEDVAKSLFKDLLKLCEDSDFVVRVSASKALGKLTNPEYFQNYIRQQKREVYLDTQLILHALCTGYSRNIKYENIYYKIVDELLNFVSEKQNISLKVSKLYLAEVAYQLKLALLLIPFEDHVKSDLSTNVFYKFYYYLRENNLLEEGQDSFADFLSAWLFVNENDAYDSQSDKIIISNITDILTNNLNIDVIHLPYYEKEQAVTVLEKVIKDNLSTSKPIHVINNDACMVMHLSNRDEHINEPFFLTWDKSFSDYRKAYKDKFHRTELILWHLFSPSKFLNHMSLLEFKIDPKSITNEYLSIIDSMGLRERTKTIHDNLNKFTDIKNISQTQRRKYVKLTNEVFNPTEFTDNIKTVDGDVTTIISKPFELIIDEINKYYHEGQAKFDMEQYRKMMLIEDYFIKVAETIKTEIKFQIMHQKSSDKYIDQINLLIEESKKTKAE